MLLYERILHSAYIYQHIVENMHDGVFTIDKSGTIITVNPSAGKILEIDNDDILNKKFSEVFIEYPENDDFNQTILDAVYKSFMSHHKIFSYYTGQKMKSLFITTSILKINDKNKSRTVGVNVVFSDITELQTFREAAVAMKINQLNRKNDSWNDRYKGIYKQRVKCRDRYYRSPYQCGDTQYAVQRFF
ncbi:MAG: PAS domain-containing protein [Syntrophomonas sp.]|nr:PAS domain-containing protein [Syntrophomonas sp.]